MLQGALFRSRRFISSKVSSGAIGALLYSTAESIESDPECLVEDYSAEQSLGQERTRI